jgi:DNA-binding beta-propeller fold protein YncE
VKRALVLAALVACASDKTKVVPKYDAYDGSAFPSSRPVVTLPPHDYALVPASGDDKLLVVDLELGTTLASAPIGRSPVLLDGPHQVIAFPPTKTAYAVYSYPQALATAGQHSHGSSTRDGWMQSLSLTDLGATGEIRLDPNPGEIAISDDGKRIVVTHFDLANANKTDLPIEGRRSDIAIIDPTAIQPYATPDPDKLLVCVAPHGLTLSRPDAKTAFVACYGEDAVGIVDLDDIHQPVVRVPVGATASTTPILGPYGVALSPDGNRLAVGDRTAHDVRFLDVPGQKMEPLVIPTDGEVYVPAWSPDGSKVYVPAQGARDALHVYDAKNGALLNQTTFAASDCVAVSEAEVSADGASVYVVCEGSATAPGAILTLDAATLAIRARAEVGFFPGRPFIGHGP